MSSFTSCSFEQLFYRNRSLGSPSTSVSLPACHKGPRTVRYFGVIDEGTRDEVLKTFVLNREATKSHLDKDSSASLMHKNSNNLGSRITDPDRFNQEFPGVAPPPPAPSQTVEPHFVTPNLNKKLVPQDLVQVLSLVSANFNCYFPFAQLSYILIDQ